jgi:hypothetical protein
VRQHCIVPSIRGRDIGFLQRPDIRSLEHLLELPDFINYSFNVHPQQYSESALMRHFALSGEAFCTHGWMISDMAISKQLSSGSETKGTTATAWLLSSSAGAWSMQHCFPPWPTEPVSAF